MGWFVKIMVLLNLIFILSASKAVKLQIIADFFESKQTSSIVFLGCSENARVHSLRYFSERNFTITTNSFGIDQFERHRNHYKLGVFIDSMCTPNEKIIRLATRLTTMSMRFAWLVWSSRDSGDAAALFDTTDMGLFSDVTLIVAGSHRLLQATKSESGGNGVSLLDIGQWVEGRGITLMETEQDTNKKRHLANSVVKAGIVFSQDVFNRNNLSKELQDILFKPGEDAGNRNTYALYLLISHLFNFSLEIRISPVYGYKNKEGNWSGAMGQIQNKEINMTMMLLPNSQRLEISYMTLPLQKYAVTYVFKQPKILGTYRATLLEFTLHAWLVVGVSVIFGGLIFLLTQRLNDDKETLFGGLLLSLGAFTNQGLTQIPNTFSSRVIAFSLLMAGTLVSMFYNAATMTSLLAPASPSIRNLENLLRSGLRLGYLNATYVNNIQARQRIFLPVIAQLMDKDLHLYSLEDGLKSVREKQAFCAEQYVVYKSVAESFLDSEICDLSYINANKPTFGVSFLQKESHFREMYQRGLLRLQEHGLKQRESNRWIEKRPACLGAGGEFTIVGPQAVSVALTVYFVAILMSLVAFTIERFSASTARVKGRHGTMLHIWQN